MKKITSFFQKYSFLIVLSILLLAIFRPLLQNQIPFSSNLLVSFFNPWAQQRFTGWEQGIPNKPVGIDDIRIFYPQRNLTTEDYLHGILPLWNPYSFSGNYHAGLSETAIFYPLSFLFLIFPQLPTWIFLLIFEPISITIGTFLFLRLLKLTKLSTIFGAIVLGFSGMVIVRMVEGFSVGHTLMWTPFVLYGIEGYFQKRRVRFLLVTLIAMCCSLLAGWFQFAFYTILLGCVYALFRFLSEKDKKQNFLVFLPFLCLPVVTLFHLIPALESFAVSSRGATTTQELLNLHLMPWSHILTYLFPDFFGNPGSYNFFGKSEYKESILYIGVIPFVLSLFGMSLWKKNKYVVFFSIVSIIGILLGIDTPLTRNILSLPIPIVSSFLPNRAFYFATIGLSILSAYGLEIILQKKIRLYRLFFVSVLTIVLVAIANGFVFFNTSAQLIRISVINSFSFLGSLHLIGQAYQIDIAKHNLYLTDGLLCLFVVVFFVGRLFSRKLLITGIFILTMLGQVYFAQKYIPFSQPKFVFPPNEVFTYLQKHEGIDRFISTGNGYIAANSSLFYNLYSPDGVGSMYIGRYGQLVTYMQTQGKDYTHIPRIEIRIAPSANEVLSGNNPYLLRFMQLDGIRYIVRLKSEPADVNEMLFQKVWENDLWEIYIYRKTLPRIFWTGDFEIIKSNTDILSNIFTYTDKNIVIESSPGFLSTKENGTAKIVQYMPNNIVVKTKTLADGFIYVSDNYVPQWKVYVDGKKTTVLRANYSFMAVPISKGQHIVELQYIDNKESLAFIISGVFAIGIVIGLVVVKKKKIL